MIRGLIVEDNPGDVRMVRELLNDAHAELVLDWEKTMEKGALHMLKERYDVVLLDLNLPDSDGLDSVFTVELMDSGMPFIVLSSLDDPAAAKEAIRMGAQDYLVKGTFDGADLMRAIEFAIARKSHAAPAE